MNNVAVAFALTLLAGSATGIGSLIAVSRKEPSPRFLSFCLGFSAGVMIYISLAELFPAGGAAVSSQWGARRGQWLALLSFFGGILVVAAIDRMIPRDINPHEMPAEDTEQRERRRYLRTGLFTAGALALHNFPEGFATFIAALQDPAVAVWVAVAIAIHNVPEGIAVAVPIRYATGSRRKAFQVSFLSGMTELLGAVIGYLVLRPFLSDTVMGLTLAGIAGVMVFISFDELLPAAHRFGHHHFAVYGVIIGMLVMAVSLLLFL